MHAPLDRSIHDSRQARQVKTYATSAGSPPVTFTGSANLLE